MERGEADRLMSEVSRMLDDVHTMVDKLTKAGYLEKPEPYEPNDPARFDVPDVNHLLFALREAGGKLRPVSASEIAVVLWDGEHGHGDVVKIGLRLRMMASVGLVERHEGTGERPNRWTLRGGDDA